VHGHSGASDSGVIERNGLGNIQLLLLLGTEMATAGLLALVSAPGPETG